MKTIVTLLACLFCLVGGGQAAEIYVSPDGDDANPGTEASPKASLTGACAIAQPGDTIRFQSGTYYTSGPFGCWTNGASWDQPVTITTVPGAQVEWKKDPAASGSHFTTGSSRSRMAYLKIIGEVVPDPTGLTPGRRNFFINGLTVRGNANRVWIEGIRIGKTGSDCMNLGNDLIVRNVHFDDCSNDGDHHAVYSHTSDSLFEDNWVLDSSGYGFHFYNNKHNTQACLVGVKEDAESPTGCGNLRNIIRGNRFYRNSSGMIINVGDGNQIYNNIFAQNRRAGLRLGATNTLVVNNTFYKNQGNTAPCEANLGQLVLHSSASGAIVRNNLVWGADQAAVCLPPTIVNLIIDHNILSRTSDVPAFDARVVDAEAYDFHLLPDSPALDAGIDVAEVTADHDGRPRPQGPAYDIGAYELTQLPPTAAEFPLETDALDDSGHGHHGTNTGVTFDLSGAAVYDSAYDNIVFPTAGLDADAFTITAWVNPAGFVRTQYVVGAATRGWNNRIQLWMKPGVPQLNLGLGNNHNLALNLHRFAVGAWAHVALVYDNGQWAVFVDGVEAGSGVATGLTQMAATMTIGNDNITQNEGWQGLLRDVRVYALALTSEEVHMDYQQE
jgi:Concanavalin A-like lectin/glucanases superfamily/Right handed beta helix region